jgi:aryl-alcohol dehydrogenase-like predicted oxidoreductase
MFLERHPRVHPDNYNKNGTSKLIFGTGTGQSDSVEDLRQYICMKHALLSGINQIDTGLTFRRYRAELVVGQVLRTLVHKYGVARQEINIISKQGWVGNDNYNQMTSDLLIKEICGETGLTSDDFIGGKHGYCLDPAYLRHSLKTSLTKMNIKTLDVAMLSVPYELYRGQFG